MFKQGSYIYCLCYEQFHIALLLLLLWMAENINEIQNAFLPCSITSYPVQVFTGVTRWSTDTCGCSNIDTSHRGHWGGLGLESIFPAQCPALSSSRQQVVAACQVLKFIQTLETLGHVTAAARHTTPLDTRYLDIYRYSA